MNKVSGYIFDYGGTIDSGGNHWGRVLWHAYERQKVGISEEQFREAYVFGERYLATHPVVKPTHTFPDTLAIKLRCQMGYLTEKGYLAEADDDMLHGMLHHLCTQTRQHVDSSLKVLRRLSERGLPMVLVSNFYGNINAVLHDYGFGGLFSAVIESAVVGVRKPDARIFQMGVDALGIDASEVLVVGDSIDKDIVPARSIGCQTAWIEGEPWDAAKPIDRSVPDRIITNLDQLL